MAYQMRAEGGDRLILLVTIEAPDLTQAISRVPSSSTTHCHFASEERLGLDVHFRAAQHPLGRSGRGWADRDGFYARPPSPSRRYGASLCPCSKYIWRWNRRRPIVEYVFRVRSVHRGHLRRPPNEWIFWARLHVSTTVEKMPRSFTPKRARRSCRATFIAMM